MKKVTVALIVFSCLLAAADVWQSKPYTEWSDRDLQKMMTNSPWARAFSVSTGAPESPPVFGRAGDNPAIGDSTAPPIGGGGPRGIPANQNGFPTEIIARWQSALPIREAFVRLTKIADPKPILDRQETNYVIVLSGSLQPLLRGAPEEWKTTLSSLTQLSAKGKGAIRPADVQVALNTKTTDVEFTFPRSTVFTLEDKEVEFTTRLGEAPVRFTFRLKDMVFNGKLEL